MKIEKVVVILAGTPDDIAAYVKARAEKDIVIPLVGHQYYCFVANDEADTILEITSEMQDVIGRNSNQPIPIQGMMLAGWEKHTTETLHCVMDVFYEHHNKHFGVPQAEASKAKFLGAMKSHGLA